MIEARKRSDSESTSSSSSDDEALEALPDDVVQNLADCQTQNEPGTSSSTSSWMGSFNQKLKKAGASVMGTLRSSTSSTNLEQKTEEPKPQNKKHHWKHRLWSTWNNIKYSSAWMSDRSDEYGGANKSSEANGACGFEDFYLDYYSRIWITYRTNFAPLLGTETTSDCGWGCMLRTTQMMVAHAIFLNRLSRNWRYTRRKKSNIHGQSVQTPDFDAHLQILQLFEDCEKAPLGIHQLVKIASKNKGKSAIGSWYTPSEAVNLLRTALLESSSPVTGDLAMMVSIGSIHIRDVDLETRDWSKRLLLVIVLRLGATEINTVYVPHLQFLFSLSCFLGVCGGRPDHSLYFAGFYGDQVIYLDPHVAHEYIPLTEDSEERKSSLEEHNDEKKIKNPLRSYHCKLMSKMHFADMDPSCAIGFLFKSRAEFDEVVKAMNLSQVIDVDLGKGEGMKRTRDPLFSVIYGERAAPSEFSRENSNSEAEIAQAQQHGFELL
ncbi:unnamed protein product [Caenorhabditis auriculariae]|uniref:Cysteine protease n=1 Tax=Caenorhabditis auriculariae TaxID=2777116 RepID=A0A8S1H7C1_9PELO|nr:unnamed protein product [Caenorhabditis auriculariae]